MVYEFNINNYYNIYIITIHPPFQLILTNEIIKFDDCNYVSISLLQ